MPALKVRIEGLNELRAALRKAPAITAQEIHSAIYQSIGGIRREVLPRTPILTGMLRQSLTRGVEIKPLSGSIGSDLPYAWIQHEGHFKHPRGGERHYLFNAVEAQKGSIIKLFERALEIILRRIANEAR